VAATAVDEDPDPDPDPGEGSDTTGVTGIIEMCFHTGSSFRTWIKYRGGGGTAV
jgi:hypothetical protein